ncbi:MAG: ATP-binding cassette domain-containing protein [Metallosphaera sp.]
MSFVRVRDLQVKFDSPVLSIDKLDIEEGESVLLTGRSGSGKSTLTSVINGVVPKLIQGEVSGEVRVFSKDASRLSVHEISLLVGTLLQDPESQILNYYVRDEIAFPMKNLGLRREEMIMRINEVAKLCGVSHLLERDTMSLSGGEKQRVVLASVLSMRPKGFILDEPTSSLDSLGTKEVLSELSKLRERMSLIIVEHKLSKVLDYVSRVIVLKEGKVALDVPREEVPKFYDKLNELGIETPTKIQKVRRRRGDNTILESYVHVKKERTLVEAELNLKDEVTVMMGVNGSGKSTLLRALAGLLPNSFTFEGYVKVNGRDLTNPKERGKYIAYLPQEVDLLFVSRTVEEELNYVAKLRKADASLVRRYLEEFSLKGEKDPLLLSVGEKRRLALASVLISGVKVLLLDEPTTGQDMYHKEILGMDLLKLKGVAVLVVTHDPRFAYRFGDRLIVLDKGRIRLDGSPEDLRFASKYGVVTESEIEDEPN